MLAAVAITWLTVGAGGVRELATRLSPRRLRPLWWLVGASPVVVFALALGIARLVDGSWPEIRRVGDINFLPHLGFWVLPLGG